MIYLDSTTRVLQAVLASAVAATQPICIVCFYDVISVQQTSQLEPHGATQITATNNTTDVTICSAPPVQGTIRNIKYINFFNRDTAAAIVTIKIDDAGTDSLILRESVPVNRGVVYQDGVQWQTIGNT